MIDQLIIELPVLALFLKFMIASTVLLGGVWLLEKTGVINTPDMSETAWKLAIVASFVALLPVSFSPSSLTIPITQTVAADYGLQRSADFSSGFERTAARAPLAGSGQTAVPVASAPAPTPEPVPNLERESVRNTARDTARETAVAGGETPLPVSDDFAATTQQASPDEARRALVPASSQAVADEPAAVSLTVQPETLLMGAWAALALIALVALALSYARAVKSLGNRTRVPAEHHANQTLRALCEQVDIRHVPYLSRSSEINSPVCLPRREICLPDWAFDDMDEKALDSLIAHELAHMLRHDPVMMIATQTLCRIFFFQPLFALARRRLEDSAELAADQWAATHLSTAKAVASALYTCAQKITEKRQIQWGLAMAGDKSILKQRVERLLKADGASFNTTGRLKRGGVAAALLIAVLSLPSVEFATAMTAGHPHEEPSREEIERMVRRLERDLPRMVTPLEKSLARMAVPVAEEVARAGKRMAAEIAADAEVMAAMAELAAAEAEASAEIVAAEMEIAAAEIEAAFAEIDHPRITHHIETDGDYYSGNMQWNDDDLTVKIRWDGHFTLNDDETSIKSMDEDGSLNIRTEENGERRRVRFTNDDGDMKTTYWVDGDKQPMGDEGERWLAETIQKMVRHTPIDIENRVERYLEQGGTKLAFKKMDELETDYVRRVFATELIDQTELKKSDVKKLVKAFKAVDSDYEVRLLLNVMFDEDLITKDTLEDVLELTNQIDSDYELRLALSPILSEFSFNDKQMQLVLEQAQSIDSDYELRLLLSAAMNSSRLSKDNQKSLISAAKTLDSDYELRLIISQFADDADMDATITSDLLEAIGSIGGDYEKRLALASVVDDGKMDDKNWMLAIALAESIDGDYEKRLALAQIRDDMPSDSKLDKAWRKAAKTVSGKHERGLLLGTED